MGKSGKGMGDFYENPAKSYQGQKKKTYKSDKGHKKNSNNKVSKTIGIILAVIQAIATCVFAGAVFSLNMLPNKYLLVIVSVLAVLFLAVLLSQILSKKKGIIGKVISVLMSAILFFGSFYVVKANSTVQEISGGNKKIDKIVVAVRAEDPAEELADTAGYNFGVQYAMKGEEIRSAVSVINEELGTEIVTTEFTSLNEQAAALLNGDVQAIIYNEAYAGMIAEIHQDYSSRIKIIYSHEIESVLEHQATEVKVEDDSFAVYISGIDVYGAIETNSRSDVNILAIVNPTSRQILLVTTPRDYYVEFPGITGGTRDKLTHAGIYGVDVSMATLGMLYDTDIDFYARVNFTSLVQMVDALGGIDVYSEYAFTTSEATDLVVNVAQGINHFNGAQALAFSRERMNLEGGDFQRGKNQQAVITAMIQKAVSPAILMGANGILESVSGNVDTNMSSEQIQTLIKSQLDQGGTWNIKSVAAEGTGDEQYCYSSPGSLLYVTWPDENSVSAIKAEIEAVKRGDVLQGAVAAE